MKIEYVTRGYRVTLDSKEFVINGDTIDDLKREFFRLLEDEINAAVNEKLRQPDKNDDLIFYMDLDDLK